MLDWQVPVCESLSLIAGSPFGVINIPSEVTPLQDVPVNLVQILQRLEELRGPQVRVSIRKHGHYATLGQTPKRRHQNDDP